MKIWIKLLIGTIIGILLGIYFPFINEGVEAFFQQFSHIIINLGRYILFPMVFFSAGLSIEKLRQQKLLRKLIMKTLLFFVLSTAAYVILGALLMFFLSPSPIPPFTQEIEPLHFQSFTDIVKAIINPNVFRVFTQDASMLLPLYFFSLVLGFHLSFDKIHTRPVVQLLDSLSRISFRINSFLTEIIGIGMIVISAYFIIQVKSIIEVNLFFQLILILSISVVIIVGGIYPLLVYLLDRKENPYKWLYGLISVIITAFLSGDSFFSLAMLIRHGHESHRVPRKIASVLYPFFTMFCKGGTAFISIICFFVILKSYSSLEISLLKGLWIMLFAFILSFSIPHFPASGALRQIALLSLLFGQGKESGYFFLVPIAFLISGFAIVLDMVNSAFLTYIINRSLGFDKMKNIKDFI